MANQTKFSFTKKLLLLSEWRMRAGIITRKQAKLFYDHTYAAGLPKANPRYTGMNVCRILREHGRCIGRMPLGDGGRMIDVWALDELWPDRECIKISNKKGK